MPEITINDLIEAGSHFGHLRERWNPKMKPFIFSHRKGIYIIDVRKTLYLFERAYRFVVERVARNEKVLFVGTKRQAQEMVRRNAVEVGMPYVSYRWLGGTLTNFATISRSIEKLNNLETMKNEGSFSLLSKKEVTKLLRDMEKMERSLGGLRTMDCLPGIVFVVDSNKEKTAVLEAKKLGIPIVALLDTNCDPDGIDYPIPANDDAVKSISIFVDGIAQACLEGMKLRQERQSMETRTIYAPPAESPEEVVIIPEVTKVGENGTGDEAKTGEGEEKNEGEE